MKTKKTNKKKHKNNNNLHDLQTGQTNIIVSKFFRFITRKERTVNEFSKNLHQSGPYAQNESCLAYKETENG